MNEPAFPNGWMPESGMTLRDYFAAAALTGLLRDTEAFNNDAKAAEWAYQFADAMLKARESQEAPHTPTEAK